MMKKIFLLQTILIMFLAWSCTENKNNQELKPGTPASVQVSAERLNRIDSMIIQSIEDKWIAGAVGFIARDGKIIYNRAFGESDLENGTPMQTDAIFRIASQTKAIASIGLMMLFEEGKFLLDDPVSKYIPEFANPQVIDKYNPADTSFTTVPASREITIRDLFTHTSGIDYALIGSPMMNAVYSKAGIMGGFGNDRITIGDDIRLLGKQPLVHQPGERFTYGLNVDVIGYLVEILSGQKLDQFLKTRLFDPLGMEDTWFYLPEDKHQRLVKVNTEDQNRTVVPMPDQEIVNYPLTNGVYFSGGAGLSSTTKDYAIFLQMLLNKGVYKGKRLLASRTVELITSNQIGDLNVGKDKFGLGFEITTEAGQAVLGISEGSFAWGGYFGTTYWADPEERLVCLLFMQQVPLSHGEIQNKFKAMVYQALDD
ncbi:MAG TPA: serine hydrolase domain-containing protein [Bacteroidales bacterium]|jgi:CubicO group peptidase (beta-lactamase class C family)|nr:beta-lactamase family protein [Bacteroidales bacterium]HNY53028.1 serine hydrolase domain-containing protein [Bacteroidales bacterium]HOG57040.1 serine hydrolase domain-containing protein [Bacteroidales bacterium]HPB13118.1 serine hydrolase domain-containing protein [Bacteroidales bacterium]HPV16555.1 serine hydrolase domain-containing protein [Bacteroidales bacterium]